MKIHGKISLLVWLALVGLMLCNCTHERKELEMAEPFEQVKTDDLNMKKSVVLTANTPEVVAYMPGTVTYSEENDFLMGIQQFDEFQNIKGLTYQAGIVFKGDFLDGKICNYGEIWNATNLKLPVTITFYDNKTKLASYDIQLNPRSQSNLVPKSSLQEVRKANKVVITGLEFERLEQFVGDYTFDEDDEFFDEDDQLKEVFAHLKTGPDPEEGIRLTGFFVFEDNSQNRSQRLTINANGRCYLEEESKKGTRRRQGSYSFEGHEMNVDWDDGESEIMLKTKSGFERDGVMLKEYHHTVSDED